MTWLVYRRYALASSCCNDMVGLQTLRSADHRRPGQPWQRALAVGAHPAAGLGRLLLLYMEGRALDGQGKM